MKKIFLILTALLLCVSLQAQKPKEEAPTDSLGNPTKTGWNFGAIPGLTYDNDKGLTYGITANIFDYGDGTYYPNYRHFIYAEGSYSTKQVGTIRLFYESDYVIKRHKLLVDFSYLPDAMNDFYGFNGNYSVFNHDFEDKTSANYLNHAFYRHKSNLFRTSVDIRGIINGNFYYYAGMGLLNYAEGRATVDKGDWTENQMELFELYRRWGLISEAEKNGGWHPYVRGGISYDTRNQRVNTVHGWYFDLFLTYNAAFGPLKDYNNLKINFDFMHFVPIIGNRLVFAYRVATQNTIAGRSPYYLDTYKNELYIDHNRYYSLGGATSIRGIMRDRIWVPGYAYATAELRSRIWNFDLFNQHFYLGANMFLDGGIVTQKYEIDEASLREKVLADPWVAANNLEFDDFFDVNANIHEPHFGVGAGLKIAMNENFVLSCEWGMPFSKQDNYTNSNFYIGMGYMF
ncbi:MAG: BamA/TamA family outer membrane protein [Bacteroidales bacterium]|nr:BamA/TamA family outer membrane protein [Bacteroidales bacterium]